MVRSVVREYHFTPETIYSLFHDGIDYFGLKFWYEDAKKINDELKPKK